MTKETTIGTQFEAGIHLLRRAAVIALAGAAIAGCGSFQQEEENPVPGEPVPTIVGTPLEAPSTSEVE